MDAAIFSAINGWHTPWLDAVMAGVSWLGYFPGVWFVAAAAALVRAPWRAAAFRMCLAVAVTYGVTSGVIKPLVARERPYVSIVGARTVEASPAGGPSFPSGHASTAVAGALAGARVWPSAAPLLWLAATTMALSRVYVGVHFPTDVVAGAFIGALCALFVLGGRHRATWVVPPPARAAARAEGVRYRP